LRRSLLILVSLIALASDLGAHSEGYPADPRPIGGGRAGGVPTPPPAGETSSAARAGGGTAIDWTAWWLWNREALLDFPSLRRARRARALLPTDLAPGARNAALVELRAAAAEEAQTLVAAPALLALGRARDAGSTALLAAKAREGRRAALIGLGLLDPSKETRSVLVGTLTGTGSSPRTRGIAALALGLSGDLAALPKLVDRATSVSESRTVVEASLVALAALGSDAASRELIPLLAVPPDASDRLVGRAALTAFVLGRIKATAAVPLLRRALRHRDVPFRRQAALSLGGLAAAGTPAARDLGIIVTGHPEPTVRATAALGLARVPGPESIGPLLLLRRQDVGFLRSFAALALARHAPRKTASILEATLAGEDDPEARGALAAALGLAGRPPVVPALRPVLTEFGPAEVRGHAALALALLGDGASRESIRALLHPPTPGPVRRDAALAAGLLADRVAEVDVTRRLFEEESEQGRAAAALALGYLGSPDAVPVLTRVLRDRGNPDALRALCAASLGRLLDGRKESPATKLAAGIDPLLPSEFLREVLSWF